MKFAKVSSVFVMASALLLASSAFAASKGHVELQNSTLVSGTQLKAGDYRLEWEGTGPDVEVSIMQGKKVLAKVPAKIVELKTRALNDSAVVTNNSDGTASLESVQFAGKGYALQLGGSSEGAQAGSAK